MMTELRSTKPTRAGAEGGTAKPAARGDDDRSVAHVAWTVELDVELAEQVRAVARALGMRPRRALAMLARYGLEALDQVERPLRLERSEKR